MIKDEFVTFETAKLLKEAGFPQDTKGLHYSYDCVWVDDYRQECKWVSKVTQAQAMRWLREERDLFIDIENRYGKDTHQWDFKLVDVDDMDNIFEFAKTLEATYEAAAEAGIQAACRYLIEKGGEE